MKKMQITEIEIGDLVYVEAPLLGSIFNGESFALCEVKKFNGIQIYLIYGEAFNDFKILPASFFDFFLIERGYFL